MVVVVVACDEKKYDWKYYFNRNAKINRLFYATQTNVQHAITAQMIGISFLVDFVDLINRLFAMDKRCLLGRVMEMSWIRLDKLLDCIRLPHWAEAGKQFRWHKYERYSESITKVCMIFIRWKAQRNANNTSLRVFCFYSLDAFEFTQHQHTHTQLLLFTKCSV